MARTAGRQVVAPESDGLAGDAGDRAAPAAVTELRRVLADLLSARLSVRPGTVPMRGPLPLDCGVWPRGLSRHTRREVTPHVHRAFFSLDWLEDDAM